MKRLLPLLTFLLITPTLLAAPPADDGSPYAVCAHLQGGEEHQQMPENLRVMKAAGIRWVRADFSWSGVQHEDAGPWRFEHLDRVVDAVEKEGMSVLPILNYNVHWATPAYKNLDKWCAYVEALVTRYKDRVRYWEVWNEQNLDGFWGEKADAKNYVILLEATYKTIKKIDPELQVVYGGLAGTPMEYIITTLDAGAAEFFDVFNVHPYRQGMSSMARTREFFNIMTRLEGVLKVYKPQGCPVWITEMGWATPPAEWQVHLGTVKAAMKTLAPDAKNWKIAILWDENYPDSSRISRAAYLKRIPENAEPVFITLDDLKTLSPQKYDALLLPPGEMCLTPFWEELVAYVKDGGTLFLFGGVPLYYHAEFHNGKLIQRRVWREASDEYRNTLRISWEAWWHAEEGKIPRDANLVVPDAMKPFFDGMHIQGRGERFLTDKKLKDGDRFIPVLRVKRDGYEGTAAAIYDYNSDFKGAVVVSTMHCQDVSGTEADQAVFLPQAYLMAFEAGVSRFFWYEFQAIEQDDMDKEHHFGIVHRNLEPKPAYQAYKTLTKARPAGSVQRDMRNRLMESSRTVQSMSTTEYELMSQPWNEDNEYCISCWSRPDGRLGSAIWDPAGEREIRFAGEDVAEMYDYLGNPVTHKNGKLKIGPGVIYVIFE